jgi:hypothetical protein
MIDGSHHFDLIPARKGIFESLFALDHEGGMVNGTVGVTGSAISGFSMGANPAYGHARPSS